ncbi:FYN-binding protein 2 isoform X2 [Rana temporaria]|uniref:FYN-binding protein 2 isoform X2 n=1 Tax=Rana temporaria TaxID=8407 RepID=UPI001AAD55BE|nr:FYN-binding protein 2 isoform X2 [Rana temporaria]
MDMEQPLDFKSIRDRFKDPDCSNTLPANPSRPRSVSNVRSNPALLGVICALENKPKPVPPQIAKKPDVAAKPSPGVLQKPSSGNKSPQNMRLSIGFKQTLNITDRPQSSGEGVCSRSPQSYRQSWSASSKTNSSLDANQSNNQEFYEVIDDSFKTLTSGRPQVPLKPQISNVSNKKSSQALETNHSDSQDCYEVVDESMKAKPTQSRPFLARLSQALPISKKTSAPVKEIPQLDAQDCYEVVNDTMRTPSTSFTSMSSFPGPEMSQPEGQEFYEEVDHNFHSQAERLPPIGGNPQLQDSFPCPVPPHSLEMYEIVEQDPYEDINSSLDILIAPPPPFNDAPKSQNDSPSMTTIPKPLRSVEPKRKISSSDQSSNKEDKSPQENRSPKPPDAKSKPKLNIPGDKTPRKKPLPSIESLGLPPPKEPRPPQVVLTHYQSAAPPCNAVRETPTVTETEYELPTPSSPSHGEECYDDASNLRASMESESNVYEVEGPQAGTPKVKTSKPSFPSPSPEGGRECYDDVETSREPPADTNNVYEVDEPGSVQSREPPGETAYEVADENKDVRRSRNLNGTYPGFRSSVSEDHYSTGTLDGNRGTLPRCDSTEGKMSKNEQAFRKKYKITGLEDAMYTTTIVLDYKPEKNMLPLKRGDVVDVLRITDCPPGKWLVKDNQGNHGLVPVSCVDISKDILTFSNQHLLTTPSSPISDLYADVERPYDSGLGTDLSVASDSNSVKSEDAYDDVDNRSSTLSNSGGKKRGLGNFFRKDKGNEVWSPSASMTSNSSMDAGGEYSTIDVNENNGRENQEKSSWRSLFQKGKEQKGKTDGSQNEGRGEVSAKKIAKEEKIFREKFKYIGDIKVSSLATITDSAPLSPKDKLGLQVKRGETIEVIDVTNEDQIICRNYEGKFGYVRIEHLNFQPNY